MFYSHESMRQPLDFFLLFEAYNLKLMIVLTSRKGGVATVWYILIGKSSLKRIMADLQRLVATLGSKSNLRKVNRKQIFDVDVPETCRIIIKPEAPMALRLQSNLLSACFGLVQLCELTLHHGYRYGVSRVFSQQCGYILSDAETAQSNIRALIKTVKTSELDPNAGKAR